MQGIITSESKKSVERSAFHVYICMITVMERQLDQDPCRHLFVYLHTPRPEDRKVPEGESWPLQGRAQQGAPHTGMPWGRLKNRCLLQGQRISRLTKGTASNPLSYFWSTTFPVSDNASQVRKKKAARLRLEHKKCLFLKNTTFTCSDTNTQISLKGFPV